MAKMNKLRAAISDAERKIVELESVMAKINNCICWHRFNGDPPSLHITSGGELHFVYEDMVLPLNYAVEYMEEVGYIVPEDFIR